MRAYLPVLLVLLSVAGTVFGASPAPTYANLEYASPGGTSHSLDLYIPEGKTGPFPLVVWIHGGGWQGGDKANPTRCPGLLEYGIAYASINYRLSGEATFPAQVHDCKAAIRWLRAHASEYDLDPSRFGVWGSSAGGHLSALVGISGDVAELEGDLGNLGYSSRVQAAVDYWGLTDLLVEKEQVTEPPGMPRDPDSCTSFESEFIGECLGDIKANIDDPAWAPWVTLCNQINPITWISADDPPFVIRHGDMDTTVPLGQSTILDNALVWAGVESYYEVLLGLGHGTTSMSEVPVYEFFRSYFGLPSLSPQSIHHVKTAWDNAPVELRGVVVTAVFSGYIFVEQSDRSSGIRVNGTFPGIAVGDVVDVSGTVRTVKRNTVFSERYVLYATVTEIASNQPVEPMLMSCRSVGGEGVPPNLPGVGDAKGLNSVGLLATIIGKVTYISGNVIYVDDGSNVQDTAGIVGVAVQYPSAPTCGVGDMVKATGVVEGNVVAGTTGNRRFIRARSLADFTRLWQAQ